MLLEHGAWGPQACELADLVISRTHDPVALKMYLVRWHQQLHGRMRAQVACPSGRARGGSGVSAPVVAGCPGPSALWGIARWARAI